MAYQTTTGGGCCCGPHKSISRINNSMSFYIARDIPTGELDQTIGWLDSIREECELKISQLEALKSDRDRAAKWRSDLNRLARQFYDDENTHLDIKTRQRIIQQRLGCEWHIAMRIAENVQAWAKRQQKSNRDHLICMRVDSGATASAVAREFKLSRQQVHNILKRRPEQMYIK